MNYDYITLTGESSVHSCEMSHSRGSIIHFSLDAKDEWISSDVQNQSISSMLHWRKVA